MTRPERRQRGALEIDRSRGRTGLDDWRDDSAARVGLTARAVVYLVMGWLAIMLATGSKPKSLPNLPIDGKRIITSDEILELKEMPKSLIVIGAGAACSDHVASNRGDRGRSRPVRQGLRLVTVRVQ